MNGDPLSLHPLQNPVVLYLAHELLKALAEADYVDANFCCISVARLVSARGQHHITIKAHPD